MSDVASQVHDVPALKRAFAEDGYLVFRDVVSQAGLAELSRRLAEEFEAWKLDGRLFRGGGAMSGHLNCAPGDAARFAVPELERAGILDLVQQLHPTPPDSMRAACNYNLPGSVAQHYHMDGLFLETFIIVNVAVVDTDLANGAIDVVPGTQKRFYKYWEFALGRVYRQSRRLQMKRGDVLIRISSLWHRGMPNQTATPRPMLAFTFGERGVQVKDTFAHNGGAIEFQPNWFTPSRLGRLRERTFVKAPITYSAYRFVRSLVGNKGYATF
jgi:ectoine hydroxylase-related dioxygenase (phytanoyl-CoA dioxygenase family)